MAFSWLINGDYELLTSWDDPPSIYLHEWLISMVNVGKHTIQYMDPMGIPPFYELNGQGQLDV